MEDRMKYKLPKDVALVIIHDFQLVPGCCQPGEEGVALILWVRGKRYWIPLGPTHMVFMDYLARCRYPEDSMRIAEQLRVDPFALYHGSNVPGGCIRPARTSRSSVRQQVHRVLEVLTSVITEEQLDLDARSIICVARTSSGTVGYFIGCSVTWEHWPQGDRHWDADLIIPEAHPKLFDHADGVRLSR
jgi:hypothetical protein